MKAIDTNLLVRIVVDDDDGQIAVARALAAEGVIIPITVWLELGWVLQSRYRFGREELFVALHNLLDFDGVTIAEEPHIRWALQVFREGGDFADAVHLVAARGSVGFVTFDKDFPSGNAIGVPVDIRT